MEACHHTRRHMSEAAGVEARGGLWDMSGGV